VVTKARVAVALWGLAVFLVGCGERAVTDFAGGTNSKDKKPIPSAVQANATPAQAGAPAPEAEGNALEVEGPTAASKATDVGGEVDVDSDGPIREVSMQYRAGRMRDPFMSLIGGEDRGDLVDLSVVKLVGVVLGEDPFCLVEDSEGTSYVLHKGDRVKNGRVVEIRDAALVCSQTILGYTTTVQLKLEEGKDGKYVG
jgi:hypothetical protein